MTNFIIMALSYLSIGGLVSAALSNPRHNSIEELERNEEYAAAEFDRMTSHWLALFLWPAVVGYIAYRKLWRSK